jgi:hypothetical protein
VLYLYLLLELLDLLWGWLSLEWEVLGREWVLRLDTRALRERAVSALLRATLRSKLGVVRWLCAAPVWLSLLRRLLRIEVHNGRAGGWSCKVVVVVHAKCRGVELFHHWVLLWRLLWVLLWVLGVLLGVLLRMWSVRKMLWVLLRMWLVG